MKAPDRVLVVLAGIAAVQGLTLLAYAVFDIVEAIRVGITGPAEVSNPMALILLVLITTVFGVGLLIIARGWWMARGWARAPFLLAQLIIGLIGYDLSQAQGSVERVVGFACMVLAVIGLVLSFAPSVRAALDDEG